MLYIRARKKKKLIPLIGRDNVFPFFVESLSSQRIYIFEKKMMTRDDDETRCVWPIVRAGGKGYILQQGSHVTHDAFAFRR